MNNQSWISIIVGVVTILTVFFGMGYHVKGLEKDIESLQASLSKAENQILIWLEDAEFERRELKKEVDNTNKFLIRKYPDEYQTYN